MTLNLILIPQLSFDMINAKIFAFYFHHTKLFISSLRNTFDLYPSRSPKFDPFLLQLFNHSFLSSTSFIQFGITSFNLCSLLSSRAIIATPAQSSHYSLTSILRYYPAYCFITTFTWYS